jgi:hypothetical protein
MTRFSSAAGIAMMAPLSSCTSTRPALSGVLVTSLATRTMVIGAVMTVPARLTACDGAAGDAASADAAGSELTAMAASAAITPSVRIR